MSALTKPNIESELSYAYIHAVAAHAGMACEVTKRHEDNSGVDARLVAWGPFEGGGYLKEVDLKIQLKATVAVPVDDGTYLSYSLKGIDRYDALRDEHYATPRILVVLFLPHNAIDWLNHTEEQLTMKRCAYWVSLRAAPPSTNKTAETVYLPKANFFNPDGLRALIARLSNREHLNYIGNRR